MSFIIILQKENTVRYFITYTLYFVYPFLQG